MIFRMIVMRTFHYRRYRFSHIVIMQSHNTVIRDLLILGRISFQRFKSYTKDDT